MTTRVRFQPDQEAAAMRPRGFVARRVYGLFALALVPMLIGVILVAAVVVGWRYIQDPAEALGVIGIGLLMFLGGAALVPAAVSRHRRFRRLLGDPAQNFPPYAFEVSETAVEFPESVIVAGDRWLLADTTAAQAGSDLVVSSPGRRSRRFPATSLQEPVADVIRVLEAARR